MLNSFRPNVPTDQEIDEARAVVELLYRKPLLGLVIIAGTCLGIPAVAVGLHYLLGGK